MKSATSTPSGKPRLTTSAMIASIAADGQKTKPAPFGHALVELARDGHCRKHPHPHVERTLEPDIGAEIGNAAGDLGGMQEHRERALHRTPARDDRVERLAVFRRHLVLAGD